jgi:hypothetical protein
MPRNATQGYLVFESYKESAAESRQEGWTACVTFSLLQAAAAPPPQSTLIHK